MLRRKRRSTRVQPVDMDMTPMIDIIFQLIIFFMIIMDMSSKPTEKLSLPDSETQEEIVRDDSNLIVINVSADGGYIIMKDLYSADALDAYLLNAMLLGPREPDDPNLSAIPVRIRGEVHAPFGHVQRVLQICGKRKYWRVDFGTESPPAD